jgi:hypothetical protein
MNAMMILNREIESSHARWLVKGMNLARISGQQYWYIISEMRAKRCLPRSQMVSTYLLAGEFMIGQLWCDIILSIDTKAKLLLSFQYSCLIGMRHLLLG